MRFNMNNKFFQVLDKIIDTFFLSILWLVFSLPVITIGASTTALYYTAHKSLRRDKGYVGRTFLKAFKDNFKQVTLMWLINLVIDVVLVLDCIIMQETFMLYLFLILGGFVIVWQIYQAAYVARFQNKVLASMKNAFLFFVANLPWSLLILLLLVVCAVVIILAPITLLFIPASLFLVYDAILERIFRKYMTEEDLQNELEEDMLERD